MGETPLSQARRRSQNGSTFSPSDVITPIPVTTTRRSDMPASPKLTFALQVLLDEHDGRSDRLNLLRLFVGDLQVELVLQFHDQLDGVQRVGVEVVNKRRLPIDL